MSALVVDASVVIKWFVPEIHSDAASRLLESDYHYFAPDLLFAETANVVWKKVRLGQLESGQGTRLVKDLEKIAVETIPSRALANEAYALAIAIGRSLYDAMYLALKRLSGGSGGAGSVVAGAHPLRMLTARATTSPRVVSRARAGGIRMSGLRWG